MFWAAMFWAAMNSRESPSSHDVLKVIRAELQESILHLGICESSCVIRCEIRIRIDKSIQTSDEATMQLFTQVAARAS